MQHNIILDTSLTGRPRHTLRGFFWNVRTLGLGWWIMCSIVNVWLGAKDMRARRFAR